MEKVNFNGVSVRPKMDPSIVLNCKCVKGTVAFSSSTGDRMALTKIEQLVDGQYHVVGYYDQRTDNLTWGKRDTEPVTSRTLSQHNNNLNILANPLLQRRFGGCGGRSQRTEPS